MSDASRTFSLRLSADDHARLDQLAQRLALDRTAVLRRLLRGAAVGLEPRGTFTAIAPGHTGRAIALRLERGGSDDA